MHEQKLIAIEKTTELISQLTPEQERGAELRGTDQNVVGGPGKGERSTGPSRPTQHMLFVPYKGHTRWADPEKGTLANDEYLSLFLYLSVYLSIYLSISLARDRKKVLV